MNRRETVIQKPTRRRTILIGALVVGCTALLFVIVFAAPIAAFFGMGGAAQFAQPPAVVSTTIAHAQEWSPTQEAIGSLSAINGADLSFEVAGVVEAIYFESGSDVAMGTKLVKLRDEDDVAKLATLQAAADLAQTNFNRDQKQLAANLISQSAFDTTAATLKSAKAAVAEQAATLDKKTMLAPFAGHLGIRNVNVGQYVNPGTAIVTLQALNPIDFDFHLPQQSLEKLQVGQTIAVKVDAFPQTTFMGKIAAIDPKVDTVTRNVNIRAALDNTAHRLLPGMYATAEIDNGTAHRYITLPQSAVTYNPYGNTVYVLTDKTVDGKTQRIATQTFVTTGDTRGDQVAVLTGLKEGDEVITSGQIKIQNGAQVTVNNAIEPKNEVNPQPVER